MKIIGLIHKVGFRYLGFVLTLFVMLGVAAEPAFAAQEADSKNGCKIPNTVGSSGSGSNQKMMKVLGKCEDGLYEGQLIYGISGTYKFVNAGTVERGEFKGVYIGIRYYDSGNPYSIHIYEGNSMPVKFNSDDEGLKNAVKEIYRLTDMGGDNHNSANRELLLNVINIHIKDKQAFYNEFIAGTGSTGIAINAPYKPTATPAAELPDDPLVFGASASPRAAKAKGKKKNN